MDRREALLQRARTKGVNPIVYWLARAVLQPFCHLYFRLSRLGREHIPASGPVILAANHRSFLDPFVIGMMTRRPVYFVAKRELFTKAPVAWVLSRLGAFPIERGTGDRDAMATARTVLARGDAVVIFPEGTRTRPGGLGRARRGVGRLALESGAPVVPIAVIGTEEVRRGWRIRPRKVRLRAGRPLRFPQVDAPSPALAGAVTDRIWPCVELQWEWLGGPGPLRRAVVLGTAAAGADLAAALTAGGVELEDHDVAAADLVVLAASARELPALLAAHGDRIGPGARVVVATTGLVPPAADAPSAYVAHRVPARAVAVLGGSAGGLVAASRDAGFLRQLRDVLTRAGRAVETTDDVLGVELAGAAADAAVLAAATASPAGPTAAGAAAGRVFAEVDAYARRHGGRPGTFAGPDGAGDPAEGLEALPLLAEVMRREGVRAPAVGGLADVVQGRTDADAWVRSVTVTSAPRRRDRAA